VAENAQRSQQALQQLLQSVESALQLSKLAEGGVAGGGVRCVLIEPGQQCYSLRQPLALTARTLGK
jgi:hypothetical protein